MSELACARCELAVVGLALCTIAVVVALARSRAITERRLAAACARWDEDLSPIRDRLTACEARIEEHVTTRGGAPPEADDEEIAALLESLRDLSGSLRSPRAAPALALVEQPGSRALAVQARGNGGEQVRHDDSPEAAEQDQT